MSRRNFKHRTMLTFEIRELHAAQGPGFGSQGIRRESIWTNERRELTHQLLPPKSLSSLPPLSLEKTTARKRRQRCVLLSSGDVHVARAHCESRMITDLASGSTCPWPSKRW